MESKTVKDVCFLGSHNSYNGCMQFLSPPSTKYLIRDLQAGYRAVELDLAESTGAPVISHCRHLQYCSPLKPFVEAIRDYGTSNTLPLFVFIDDSMTTTCAKEQAADLFIGVLGSRLLQRSNNAVLADMKIGDIANKVIIITSSTIDPKGRWGAVTAFSMTHRNFYNLPYASGKQAIESMAGVSSNIVRLYPESLLFSTNQHIAGAENTVNFLTINTDTAFFMKKYSGEVTSKVWVR